WSNCTARVIALCACFAIACACCEAADAASVAAVVATYEAEAPMGRAYATGIANVNARALVPASNAVRWIKWRRLSATSRTGIELSRQLTNLEAPVADALGAMMSHPVEKAARAGVNQKNTQMCSWTQRSA